MNILFICTHNRCRSILGEAIMRQIIAKTGNHSIQVKSAGSSPVGKVHPLTLEHLKRRGFNEQNLQSKSWNDLGDYIPDMTITVCDNAAKEVCPLYFSTKSGNAIKVHWGLNDPSKADIADENRQTAFDAVIGTLEKRINRACCHDFGGMTDKQIKEIFDEIGEI